MNSHGSPSRSPTAPQDKVSAANSKPVSPPGTKNRLGRYNVTGRLGQGGMGVVYLAEDSLLKRQVAIKLLPRDVSSNPEALKRFLREGQSAARLNHPNVVAVHDIGEADGTHFIVMELVKGGSAQDFLQRQGRFPWREATSILADVCRGVMAAHKAGLIHRDIKPANILRSEEGVVKLGDFGLVKAAGRKGTVVTTLGAVMGTPYFMSPEQGQSASVDERSDIYSLGATYFALLTGRPPYLGNDSVQVLFAHSSMPVPDPRDASGDIPERCSEIIRKAMAKNRSERYADVGALLADLEGLLRVRGEATQSPAELSSPFVWCKPDAPATTASLSIADVYPGERTTIAAVSRAKPRWKAIGLSLAVLLVLTVIVALSFRGSAVVPQGKAVIDDWPSLAAASEKVMRERRPPAIHAVLERIRILQNRNGPVADVGEQDAMALAAARLEKALSFRESITEKGLVLGTSGHVSGIAFSPDDRWLAVGVWSGDGGVSVMDSWTGEKKIILGPRRNKVLVNVQALAFSHDSKSLAAVCRDNLGVKIWQIDTGIERTFAMDKNVNRVLSLACSPSARKLVVGLEPFGDGFGRQYLKTWDIDTGEEPFAFKAEHRGKVVSVVYTAAGKQIASGSSDTRVVMWDAESGRIWREFRTGLDIRAVACAPHGGMLTVAGMGPTGSSLQFYDYPGERLVATRSIPQGACGGLAYSSDGSLLASGAGSEILIWNADTHEVVATLKGHGQDVTSLAFAARGGILVSGGSDQTMRLWDVTRLLPPRAVP